MKYSISLYIFFRQHFLFCFLMLTLLFSLPPFSGTADAFRSDGFREQRIYMGKIVFSEQGEENGISQSRSKFTDMNSNYSALSRIPSKNSTRNIFLQSYLYPSRPEKSFFRKSTDEDDMWQQFTRAFSKEIINKYSALSFVNSIEYYQDGNSCSEFSGFALYENELEEISYIRRDIAVNTLSASLVKILEKTKLGMKIKEFEQNITRYFKMEYSKSVYDDSAVFYLPGQVSGIKRGEDEDKEYKFSFTSLFHVDSDSLSPEIAFRLQGDFYENRAGLLYDFSNNEASLTFENRALNALIGANTGLAFIYDDDEFSGEWGISFDF